MLVRRPSAGSEGSRDLMSFDRSDLHRFGKKGTYHLYTANGTPLRSLGGPTCALDDGGLSLMASLAPSEGPLKVRHPVSAD